MRRRLEVTQPNSNERPLSDAGEHRAVALAEQMISDTSEYSVAGRVSTESLRHVMHLAEASAPSSTLDTESSQWRYWVQFCGEANPPIRPWRDNVASNTGQDPVGFQGEILLQAEFLCWLAVRMQPKRKADQALGLPAKPSSILGALLGVRRKHKRATGFNMAPLGMALTALKGIVRDFAKEHGATYVTHIQTQRAEPLTNEIIGAMLALLTEDGGEGEDVKLGKQNVARGSEQALVLIAIIMVMAQAGFRKNEIAVRSHSKEPWNCRKPSRDNVAWHLQGTPRPVAYLTEDQLLGLRVGDFCVVTPPPSKCDSFGEVWGSKPILLPFHPSEEINAARALRDLELMAPCAPQDRKSTPLFVNTQSKLCFTYGELDGVLTALLTEVLPLAALAKQYTWHSFRVYLCTALFAANPGISHGYVQAMLRWQTDQSIKDYHRLDYSMYSKLLGSASSVRNMQAITTPNVMPVCDLPDDHLRLLNGLVEPRDQ